MGTVDYFDGRMPAAASETLQRNAREAADQVQDERVRDLLLKLADGKVGLRDFLADTTVSAAVRAGMSAFGRQVAGMTPQQRRALEVQGVEQARQLGLIRETEPVPLDYLEDVGERGDDNYF